MLNCLDFYQVVDDLGVFLFTSPKVSKVFVLEEVLKAFTEQHPQKDTELFPINLSRLVGLFTRVGLFIEQKYAEKTQTQSQTQSQSQSQPQHKKFVLNPFWSYVFLGGSPLETSDFVGSPQLLDHLQRNRLVRTIYMLCFLIIKELKKEPQTREQLSENTGFARQRICTVLSVFKGLGLITETNKRKGAVTLRKNQTKILASVDSFSRKIVEIHKQKRAKILQLLEMSEQLKLRLKNQTIKNKKQSEMTSKLTSNIQNLLKQNYLATFPNSDPNDPLNRNPPPFEFSSPKIIKFNEISENVTLGKFLTSLLSIPKKPQINYKRNTKTKQTQKPRKTKKSKKRKEDLPVQSKKQVNQPIIKQEKINLLLEAIEDIETKRRKVFPSFPSQNSSPQFVYAVQPNEQFFNFQNPPFVYPQFNFPSYYGFYPQEFTNQNRYYAPPYMFANQPQPQETTMPFDNFNKLNNFENHQNSQFWN